MTRQLWRGTLIVDPVTKRVGEQKYRLDSVLAGLHLGEPVLLLECHAPDQEAARRRFVLRPSQPGSERSSPLFILLKPGVAETYVADAIGLQLASYRFAGSSAESEMLAKIGVRGKVVLGPEIRRFATENVPARVRDRKPVQIKEDFEPKVQTLLDRFHQSFRLPGQSRSETRNLWMPVAWVGQEGRILTAAEVAKAMSGIEPLTKQRSGIALFAQGLIEDQRSIAYLAVSLEFLVLERDLDFGRQVEADSWRLDEEFHVTPVPGDFELDRGSQADLPHPDLEIAIQQYEMTKGTISDSLVTKILLTPITLTFDLLGIAIDALFSADLQTEKPRTKTPTYQKAALKWHQVRKVR